MTHVVNLLPWRDLRRRQRLRYTLLLAIGIVLLAGMTLQVGRTAGLQRDALARLHATADAALLASLKQREQAMREAWQQHQRQREQLQRRSTIAAWQPRLMALAADLPAQAWLTRLEYQGARLTLDGLALNLQALAGVEASLASVTGFAPAKAGGTQRDAEGAGGSVSPCRERAPMRINTLRTRAGLLILLAMGLTGGGVALWRDARPPLAALSRDGALQTQWRRIMALRIPDGERSGERIDKQPFSPIAIPLAGAKLIAWHPQGSGGEMELALSWPTVPALFSWLARSGMNPRSFSLEREGQALRMQLQLEAEDGR
ncbi:Type IV pilus biogenesis protein PilO [Klebsiella quasipneumoniae]|uniref:Type IV pilus biogenesis protein PilO n=2 Tax=Klebsiella/Raoultella group TaxID=2890311 RepID=A0ABD7MYN3_9ENTR|nr:Type IV pilus biogenesis protein PilO [Klebsiella quasipneumoniae]SSG56099.1 Type IV pilus biogenesis protein PilO [Klebsiella quasipneumoniae]